MFTEISLINLASEIVCTPQRMVEIIDAMKGAKKEELKDED